ncbi:Chitin binding domain [Sergentomyia squamirostris]
MKVLSAFVLCALVALSVARSTREVPNDHTNGQPGCKTPEEVETRVWRNNWDPTRYWVCEVQGQAAAEALCPPEQGFLTEVRGCVPWADWEWVQPVAPPSRP